LGIAVVLYITLTGISITAGWIKLSMSHFLKMAIKIGLIYSFAMNWGHFSEWIVTGIQGSAEQIGNWLLTATPIAIPKLSGSGIEGGLQSVFTEIARLSQWVLTVALGIIGVLILADLLC
jgi:type IV secretion system protein VirB6